MNPLPLNKYDKFRLTDFFQIAIDDFCDGDFMFLSVKNVKTKVDDSVNKRLKRIDEHGWIISTWSYYLKRHYKIFVCDYAQSGWENSYHLSSDIANLNGCDGYAQCSSIQDFSEWVQPL
jgi:hypothetical protein